MNRSALASLSVLVLSFASAVMGEVPRVPVGSSGIENFSCTPLEIPNYEIDTLGDRHFRLRWSPPAPSLMYEVVARLARGFCEPDEQEIVIATTTGTSQEITLGIDNRKWLVYVRDRDCQQISTRYGWILESFLDPPPDPMLSLQSVTANSVTFVFQQEDDRNYLLLERWGADGQFQRNWFLVNCPPGSAHGVTDSPVSPGVYRYRLRATNRTTRFSPFIEVNVGNAAPPRISFSASPSVARAGQPVRLTWSVENATSVDITPLAGARASSGSEEVTPTGNTTFTLSATGPGGTASESVSIEVLTDPEVRVSILPRTLVQGTSAGGATTTFAVTNIGGQETSLTFSRFGQFFTFSPSNLSLAPGESKEVTITTSTASTGRYEGAVEISGHGVPSGLRVPVVLLAVPTPSGPTDAKAAVPRVDLSTPATTGSIAGSAVFTNTGQAPILGAAASDVPWLVPESALLEIAPGESREVPFTVDRARRGDASAPSGSVAGNLFLVFREGPPAKRALNTGVPSRVAPVGVTDTARPSTQTAAIPPLSQGEKAAFIAGVGHVVGSTGQFISDISLTNLTSSAQLSGVALYYATLGSAAPASSSLLTQLQSLTSNTPLQFSDIVNSVFSRQAELGTLVVRSADLSRIGLSATILNTSDPRGTFGTSIPTLRSDRSAGVGEDLFLTGLRKNAGGHTNIFVQETTGSPVTVTTSYLDENGVVLFERTDTIPSFGLLGMFDDSSIPSRVAAARVRTNAGSAGRVAAYATPVDRLSRDFWSITDWNRQSGMSGSEPMLIPVAGKALGANNAFFRTDVSFTNSGSVPAVGSATYRFTDLTTGGSGERTATVNLAVSATESFDDVVTSLFGLQANSLGYITFVPQSGTFAVSSRTFSTVGGQDGTFGTGVPVLPLSSGMKLGEVRTIGGVEDASAASVSAKRGGTFRTNFGLVETAGQPVTVRVTVYFSYEATGKAVRVGRDSASKDYTLAPRQSVLIQGLTRDVVGEERRNELGDLRNLEVEFAVIGGSGAVVPYVSSVDNGTSDSILRTE